MTTRRDFIKSAAIATSLFPMIAPSRIFGATAPSKIVNIAMIGTGSIANHHHLVGYMQSKDMCKIVGCCDAFKGKALKFAYKVDKLYSDGSKCKVYNNYKEILADPSIDAVSIASHDHTHVPLSIEAARAGKHIYCEKSLSLNMDWSKHLKEVLDESGVVWQFGTQQRNLSTFKRQVELVRNGYIGNVSKVYCACDDVRGLAKWSKNKANPDKAAAAADLFRDLDKPDMKIPANFDYDMWQFVAQERPYSTPRVKTYGGYHIYDYALGHIANWGIHPLDIAQWGLNMDNSSPNRAEGTGSIFLPENVNTVYDWDIEYTCDNGTKIIFITNASLNKLKKKYPDFNKSQVMFIGDEGWLCADRGYLKTSDDRKFKNIKFKEGDNHWKARMGGYSHFDDFLFACRGESKNVSTIDVALRSDSLSFIADAVVRTGKSVEWDSKNMVAKDAQQKALMTSRVMRDKWKQW